MKHLLAGLVFALALSSAAWAQPMSLRDLSQRAAEERHAQLVFDDSIDRTVDADAAHPQKSLSQAAHQYHFETFKLGSSYIVGTRPFVARYRDVVTSILQVQPGHEQAVAAEIARTYVTCDTSFDKRDHEVIVKVPRFLYSSMKVAVARIDNNLPATATGP